MVRFGNHDLRWEFLHIFILFLTSLVNVSELASLYFMIRTFSQQCYAYFHDWQSDNVHNLLLSKHCHVSINPSLRIPEYEFALILNPTHFTQRYTSIRTVQPFLSPIGFVSLKNTLH